MNIKQKLISTFGWGFILWLIGYALGFIFFMFVPASLIGWFIMPIGAAITIWVVLKKIERESFGCYIGLGVVWALMAVVLDYLFIVKALKPADGYYKFDVYIYYALTFLIPVVIGYFKMRKPSSVTPATPASPTPTV
jgi:hypothetical protein